MEPVSISEKMMYTTVRIEHEDSFGTGFFFEFKTGEADKAVPILITNKHVINYKTNTAVKFSVHVKSKTGKESNFTFNFSTVWVHHPTHDLCFCYVAGLYNYLDKKGLALFNYYFTEDDIWDEKKLLELSALEDVVMAGYPYSLYDTQNNFPLFRKGITASHPAVNFKNKNAKPPMLLDNIGVVDMACFPGSSGSPICILNEGLYSVKTGAAYAGNRIVFLGVQYSITQVTTSGEFTIVDTPTQVIPVFRPQVAINIGYYIKAIEILKFKPMINFT